jgi:hypothetical protein
MDNRVFPPELPMGLGIALAKNPPAMNRFTQMTKVQKQAVIEKTHSITSPAEMQAFVENLTVE